MTKSFKQNVTSAVAITLEISQMFQGHGFHCETNTGPCVFSLQAISILRTAIFYFQLAFLNAFRLDFRRSLVSGLPSPNSSW